MYLPLVQSLESCVLCGFGRPISWVLFSHSCMCSRKYLLGGCDWWMSASLKLLRKSVAPFSRLFQNGSFMLEPVLEWLETIPES